MKKMNEFFRIFAKKASELLGTSWAFLIAVLTVLVWIISGPIFHYSQTWQLVINTGTTIITFLMVFILQNTQNRDSTAIHLKLDELIEKHRNTRNELVGLEEATDEEIQKTKDEIEIKKTKERKIQVKKVK